MFLVPNFEGANHPFRIRRWCNNHIHAASLCPEEEFQVHVCVNLRHCDVPLSCLHSLHNVKSVLNLDSLVYAKQLPDQK